MTTDEKYMKEAIRQAKKAKALDEVPIGCVIVYEDKIIARGYNRRNTDKNTLSHAELNAIRKASKKLGDWRLEGCTMYITLEPCQMCAGAIVQSRMKKGNRSGESIKGGHRKHESEGRLRRFRFKYFADGSLQSSGGTDKRSSSGRMQHHAK